MNCCPTCGQAVATAALLVDLDANRVSYGGRVAKLVPSETEVLFTLARAAPGMVSNDQLRAAIWGGAAAERESNVIKVHISRLRKKLAPLGIHIETHRGYGYSLKCDPAMLRDAKRLFARRRAA